MEYGGGVNELYYYTVLATRRAIIKLFDRQKWILEHVCTINKNKIEETYSAERFSDFFSIVPCFFLFFV